MSKMILVSLRKIPRFNDGARLAAEADEIDSPRAAEPQARGRSLQPIRRTDSRKHGRVEESEQVVMQ